MWPESREIICRCVAQGAHPSLLRFALHSPPIKQFLCGPTHRCTPLAMRRSSVAPRTHSRTNSRSGTRPATSRDNFSHARSARACLARCVLVRKARRTPARARKAILSWQDAFSLIETSAEVMLSAADLATDHQLSIRDAVILSAAAEGGCRLRLFEDLQEGFTWKRVTVTKSVLTFPPQTAYQPTYGLQFLNSFGLATSALVAEKPWIRSAR